MEKIDVALMGKDYQLSCKPEDKEDLRAAAQLLSDRLDTMARATGVSGERLAMMTALSVANELVRLQRAGGFDIPGAKRKIGAVLSRLEDVLARQEKLF